MYIWFMEKVEKILENIIEYVISNDVVSSDNTTNDIIDRSGYELLTLNDLSPKLVWKEVSDILKIDNISKYLLENFRDAISKEDYTSASYMKNEIHKRLSIDITELNKLSVDLVVDLKNGCSDSKLLNYLTDDVNDLLINWGNNDYVLKGIEVLRKNINSSNPNEVKNEILDTILEPDKTHPVLVIEIIELLLKLLLEDGE